MKERDLKQDIEKILLDEETIKARVAQLGAELCEEYEDKNPVIVCILKGAVFFYADLCRRMPIRSQLDFMRVSSYGNASETSGAVRITKDLDTDIRNRHVIIVEDIMDSGLTLFHLKEVLRMRDPASIRIVCFLDKPSRRQCDIAPDYKGFAIEDHFVVGYGLDYAEKYRNFPFVGILKPEIYGEKYND